MLSMRAELLSENGALHIEGRHEGVDGAVVGAALAADLLDRAPSAVRRLFQP